MEQYLQHPSMHYLIWSRGKKL